MRFLSIFTAALLFSFPVFADESAYTGAALHWLKMVDAGQYEQSWEQAAPYFRQKVNSTEWQELVSGVRAPLGTLVKRELRGARAYTSLPGAPAGQYQVIEFLAHYQLKPEAIETVTVRKLPQGWYVVGYFIR